jgi:hypothetical protein
MPTAILDLIYGSSFKPGLNPTSLPIGATSFLSDVTIEGDNFRIATAGNYQITLLIDSDFTGSDGSRISIELTNITRNIIEGSFQIDANNGEASWILPLSVSDVSDQFTVRAVTFSNLAGTIKAARIVIVNFGGSGGGGAPDDAAYILKTGSASLPQSRVLANGPGIIFDDNGTLLTISADELPPLPHASTHENGGSDEINVAGLSGLLADAQNPTLHATSHQSGGSDALSLDTLAAPTDNTNLDASISAHGLLPKLGGGTTDFLRADGAWAEPGNSVLVPVDFGASFNDKAQAVVTGQAWVTANSNIVATVRCPTGTDPDELYLISFNVVISDLVPGSGFTVTVYTSNEARGAYDVMCIGV